MSNDSLTQLLAAAREVLIAKAELEARWSDLKARISCELVLREATTFEGEGVKAKLVVYDQTTIDATRLRKERPKTAAKYSRTTTISRLEVR